MPHFIHGGHIKDLLKPYKFRYPCEELREVDITITCWKPYSSLGANGHFHIDIREDDNPIWDEKQDAWVYPWREDYGTPYWNEYQLVKGRTEMECELNTKEEAGKWIQRTLNALGITGKTHTLHFNFYGTDEDDENYLNQNIKLREEI